MKIDTISQLLDKLDMGITVDSRLLSSLLDLEYWIINGYVMKYVCNSNVSVFEDQWAYLNKEQVVSLINIMPLTPMVIRAKLDLTIRLLSAQ